MACNPDRKGRCFQGGYIPIKKTNLVRKPDISPRILQLFYTKYGVTP